MRICELQALTHPPAARREQQAVRGEAQMGMLSGLPALPRQIWSHSSCPLHTKEMSISTKAMLPPLFLPKSCFLIYFKLLSTKKNKKLEFV